MNWRLTDDGDIDLSGGRLWLVDGVDEIRQAIRVALRLHRGEWLFDQSLGVDYQRIATTRVDPAGVAREELRRAILAVDGVIAVNRLDVEIDAETRTATVDFEARVENRTATQPTPTGVTTLPSAPSSFSLATIMSRIALRYAPR
jgi:phage baseplate assembly protein W